MRKFSIVALILAAGVLLLVLSYRMSGTSFSRRVSAASKMASASARQQPGLSDDGTQVIIRFASNPQAMPPFLLSDLDGNIVSTAALRGKVVLLNFWATWCPPCRDEIPMMIELSHRYKDKLEIIGVSMDDAPPREVKDFAKNMGIDYPIVMGSGTFSREYGGVPALPTSFVVDTQGRIVQKHEGLYSIDTYDTEIRALLGMPVTAKVETFEDTGQIFLKNAINAKELPGVDFKGLTEAQKHAALKRLNSQLCTCGCKLTIAQCRINDSSCSTSQQLAEKIVRGVQAGPAKAARPAAAASSAIRQ